MAKKTVKAHEPSALRLPGFNAVASLYSSHTTYRSSGGPGESIGAVQPALTAGCLANCMKHCGNENSYYCVTDCLCACHPWSKFCLQ
jgi:hypothetical protein